MMKDLHCKGCQVLARFGDFCSAKALPHNLRHIADFGDAVEEAHAHIKAVVVPLVSSAPGWF